MAYRFLILPLAGLVTLASISQAGLYVPEEGPDLIFTDGNVQPLPFSAFQLTLSNLQAVNVPGSDAHKKLTKQRDDLRSKRPDRLSTNDLLRLSSAHIRLRDPEQAFAVLSSARQRDPRNFVILSQTALVSHLMGSPDALSQQQGAIQMRPKEIPGFTPEQTKWYLRVESTWYEILKLRRREQRDLGPRTPIICWDDVFGVAFTMEDGSYRAGAIAADQFAKLPADSIAIVQQLLLWMPDDSRLYWLLAELYNATGDVASASTILDDCINARRLQPDLLRDHRRTLREALTVQAEKKKETNWREHPEIIWTAVAIASGPLLLLLYWQVRQLRRRFGGDCQTGL